MHSFMRAGMLALLAGAVFGQSPDAPKFDIADVHASPKSANAGFRPGAPRNGRYEMKNATMLDLVRLAYGFSADTIAGGPNWLELDRFDVIAKIPSGADKEAQKAMLQSLLEDRFKLIVRKETKPVNTWVLAAGKQYHLKEADGSGQTGCKMPESSGAPVEGGLRLMGIGQDGKATQINISPGGLVQYSCRNLTMAAFAVEMKRMLGAQLGPEPVIEETGLKGMWNFDLHFSIGIVPPNGQAAEHITLAEAVDKQLGLKLEQKPVPKQVLTIASVNRTPSPNPPGVAEALPAPTAPKEFEVADVKLAPPPSGPVQIQMQMQPGGRFVCRGCPLGFIITRAFSAGGVNLINNRDQIAGMPAGVDAVRVDITARTTLDAAAGPVFDNEALAPMLRNLLADRFKLAFHDEERPVTAYSLTAVKPKMKKADPESRIFCRRGQAPPGSPPATQVLTCQNATMAFFAEQLLQNNPALTWPVPDATGIEGGWDFTLSWSAVAGVALNGPGRGGDGGQPGALPSADDPNGGYTIFEAIEKQLGLKLKGEKRNEKMIVIDHIEMKPTEN